MPVKVRGKTDPILDRFVEVLERYQADHPKAQIDLYRQNRYSIRVRILDPGFEGKTKVERSNFVWKNYLDKLSDEDQSDLSALILLTADETSMSLSNLEFEDPTPSRV
ncbi:MAG: hypothetical protein U0800_24760 [Isosphaeraceae bacterium]